MAFDFDEVNPGDSDTVSQYPPNERAARAAVKGAFEVDHTEADGKHKKVTLPEGAAPAATVGEGYLYTKDVGGITELFYREDLDAGGTEIQVTDDGKVLAIGAIANGGGVPDIESGLEAARPAFGNAGHWFLATDTLKLYRDTGSAWVLFGGINATEAPNLPTPAGGDEDKALFVNAAEDGWEHEHPLKRNYVEVDIGLNIDGTNNDSAAIPAGYTSPSLVIFYLECLVNDEGYLVGDRVAAQGSGFGMVNTGNYGMTTWWTDTEVGWARENGILMIKKSGGDEEPMEKTSWKCVARIWP